MEEIQVPGFVNERYYSRKQEEQKEQDTRRIKNLKIYKKVIKLIGLGAVLAIVGTNPKVQHAFDVVIDKVVEYDNAKFNEEKESEIREIEELNGRSIEDITSSGKSMR